MTHDPSTGATIGVDTHKHSHFAAARDQLGRPLGSLKVPATTASYAELLAWARGLGDVVAVGVEGPGARAPVWPGS